MSTGPTAGWTEAALEDALVEVARALLLNGDLGSLGGDAWACRTVCVELCPETVQKVLTAGAARVGVASGDAPRLTAPGSTEIWGPAGSGGAFSLAGSVRLASGARPGQSFFEATKARKS